MQFSKTALVAALAAVCLPAAAIDVNLDFAIKPAASVTVATPVYSGKAGEFVGLIDWTSGSHSDAVSFETYCTDLLQHFTPGAWQSGYVVVAGATAWGAAKAADLGRVLTYFGTPANAVASAVVQTAVWEVIYEPGSTYDFGSGSFKATGGSAGVAAALAAVSWSSIMATTPTVTVDKLYSREYQDFLVTTPVPEPSTYALLLAGLGASGFVARRRRED